MKKILNLTILLALFALTGCLKFGDNLETTSPTKKQIDQCRSVMYLSPAVTITPVGYKFRGDGMDRAIWFKFKTDAEEVKDIFDRKTVDTTKFKQGFKFSNINKATWWNPEGKKLLGGQVALPNVKFMNVGIEKVEDAYVVYIMWHEV